VLTAQIAEEMLFDADISGDGGVAYDDLMTCIETIGTHEVYHAMETNRTGLRAIQEAKIGEQYRSAVDEHGAVRPLTVVVSAGLMRSHARNIICSHTSCLM